MSVPLRHLDMEPRYSAFDADDRYEDAFALSPHERIGGAPVADTSNALAWSASIAIIVCAGWVLINDPASWPAWVSDMTRHAFATVDQNAGAPKPPPQPPIETASTGAPYGPQQAQPPNPAPAASAAPSPPSSAPPQPASPVVASKPEEPGAEKPAATHEAETAPAEKEDAGSDTDDNASDSSQPEKIGHDAEASELPPARLERPKPRDRIEARAEAVGLHPGLSHAVLTRFSTTDFRNARKAIDTAIARTPDNGVFIWPRRHEPGRALFRVHFVAGAGPDCRRYVVTVTMNGWTTTALPMETCGARRVTAQK